MVNPMEYTEQLAEIENNNTVDAREKETLIWRCIKL